MIDLRATVLPTVPAVLAVVGDLTAMVAVVVWLLADPSG
jgi:hypothetical protein